MPKRRERQPEELELLKNKFDELWTQYIDPLFGEDGKLPDTEFEWLSWIAREVGISYPSEVIRFLAQNKIDMRMDPLHKQSLVLSVTRIPTNPDSIFMKGISRPRAGTGSTNFNADGSPIGMEK